MAIVKVYERLYKDGKRDVEKRPVQTDIVINNKVQVVTKEIPKFKIWYMDLTDAEELLMRETGVFAFESVPSFVVDKISPVEIDAGMKRKEEILY